MKILKILLFINIINLLFAADVVSEPVTFSLKDMQGKVHKLSDYRGKWIVVNFWATWCPPCLKEIPELIDFYEAHKNKDAVVLGVDYESIKLEDLKEFVESYFISYPVLLTKPNTPTPFGAIDALPSTFLVSPSGELVAKQSGPVSAKMIEEFIAGENNSQLRSTKDERSKP